MKIQRILVFCLSPEINFKGEFCIINRKTSLVEEMRRTKKESI
tara:strand:+ start:1452 stop:1580 length:129 start_codon:yes stop_codon:yes gene_type:complete